MIEGFKQNYTETEQISAKTQVPVPQSESYLGCSVWILNSYNISTV